MAKISYDKSFLYEPVFCQFFFSELDHGRTALESRFYLAVQRRVYGPLLIGYGI